MSFAIFKIFRNYAYLKLNRNKLKNICDQIKRTAATQTAIRNNDDEIAAKKFICNGRHHYHDHRRPEQHKCTQLNAFKKWQWQEQQDSFNNKSRNLVIAGSSGVLMLSFNLFGLTSKQNDENEETPEGKLISTIKRSILCIQRVQYEKAERMLHLALRMAQELQHKDGITYVYDIMANLAMEREQFKKAEKLFAEVMRRLFADGYEQDSPQVLHINAKLAHMAQLQGEMEKAKQGFDWTIGKIETKLKRSPTDKDLEELLGLTKNWFGQLLMSVANYSEAKKVFQEALKCLVNVYGLVNEEAVTILNNLSVACVNMDEFEEAKNYLLQALEIVKDLKDSIQEGILKANLGLVYLREGFVDKAKDQCSQAYRLAKQQNNGEAIEQAGYCLDEIKAYLQQNK